MSDDGVCRFCGEWSRHPCGQYRKLSDIRWIFARCYNISEDEKLLNLSIEGDESAGEILRLKEENRDLKRRLGEPSR